MINKKPSYLKFNRKNYFWKNFINYRVHPTHYRVGKGEQGVLICQPYKSEIGQYWKFKTPEIALWSSEKIWQMFLDYLAIDDFVGADMARKYLQMGFTRSRRYANYRGGIKYDKFNDYQLKNRGTGEKAKAVSAEIFFKKWQAAENNPKYQAMKAQWKKNYG